jgi:hypothetical protein
MEEFNEGPIDNVIVHGSYAYMHKLRKDYWKSKFYGMKDPTSKECFRMVHVISELYAGDKKYGVDDTNRYFEDCISNIVHSNEFDYVPSERIFNFANALLLNDHKRSIESISSKKMGNVFEEVLLDYVKSRYKP